jgi:hypothetical protein
MSRSGYSEDGEIWDFIKWRGRVASAIRGRRGQRLLLDLVNALDALPEKRLISEELILETGDVCALGAVGLKRGVLMWDVDPYDQETVAKAFDIAPCLAKEIAYINDEEGRHRQTPEERWRRVRAWAVSQLQPTDKL